MRRIAHLSDLHFGRLAVDRVDALRVDLARNAINLIVISGDLTQRARHTEFEAARKFIREFGVPVVAVPGNHDIPAYNLFERFVAPNRRYNRYIAPYARDTYIDEELAVAAVDTAVRARFSFDWSGGRIRRKVAGAVTRWVVKKAQGRSVVVVAHHVLKSFSGSTTLGDRLRNDALVTLARSGVDLVLGGHHHRAEARIFPDQGNAPGLVVSHAATATSSRHREEDNSYNLIDVAKDTMTWSVRSFADGAFCLTKRLCFEKAYMSGWRIAP